MQLHLLFRCGYIPLLLMYIGMQNSYKILW